MATDSQRASRARADQRSEAHDRRDAPARRHGVQRHPRAGLSGRQVAVAKRVVSPEPDDLRSKASVEEPLEGGREERRALGRAGDPCANLPRLVPARRRERDRVAQREPGDGRRRRERSPLVVERERQRSGRGDRCRPAMPPPSSARARTRGARATVRGPPGAAGASAGAGAGRLDVHDRRPAQHRRVCDRLREAPATVRLHRYRRRLGRLGERVAGCGDERADGVEAVLGFSRARGRAPRPASPAAPDRAR